MFRDSQRELETLNSGWISASDVTGDPSSLFECWMIYFPFAFTEKTMWLSRMSKGLGIRLRTFKKKMNLTQLLRGCQDYPSSPTLTLALVSISGCWNPICSGTPQIWFASMPGDAATMSSPVCCLCSSFMLTSRNHSPAGVLA